MSLGLATSRAVLTLMWFGVSGVLHLNSVDLAVIGSDKPKRADQ